MSEIDFDGFMDRLRQEADIVSIVSEYVPLKKKGKNYWGCCPFHNEKTPSFSVTPDKGFFYCFGCHAGGNVVNFLMKIENISFMEAVKQLADRFHIDMPSQHKSDRELQRDKEYQRLYHVNSLARDFFHSCLLNTKYGYQGLEYLHSRGLTNDDIEMFRLGFSPPTWDKLLTAFKVRGVSEELLLKAGLIVRSADGHKVYDRFRGRLMFPISDARSRVLGFGGRVIGSDQPKYLNSPETMLFNKKYILYGLDTAYKSIKEEGRVVIVEGYMDVIAAQTAGVRNTVASMGTAFTVEQARRLIRYAGEIVFAYDSDAAGQQATLRALELARSMADVRVVTIPDGKDPDEFIRKRGAEAFRAVVKNAVPLLEHKLAVAMRTHDCHSLEGKVAVVTELLPALAAEKNEVQTALYITRLSQVLGIDEVAVRSEYQRFLRTHGQHEAALRATPVMRQYKGHMATAVERAQHELIWLMAEDNSIIPYVMPQLPVEYLEDAASQEIMAALYKAGAAGQGADAVQLAGSLSDEAVSLLSYIMSIDFQCEDVTQVVDDCLRTIQAAHLNILFEQHRLRADELERMGDSGFLQELAESKRIKDEIKKLYQ